MLMLKILLLKKKKKNPFLRELTNHKKLLMTIELRVFDYFYKLFLLYKSKAIQFNYRQIYGDSKTHTVP